MGIQYDKEFKIVAVRPSSEPGNAQTQVQRNPGIGHGEIEAPYGKIQAKYASIGDRIVNVSPEYEDCKKAAREHDVPLKKVLETVRKLAE